MESSQDCLGIDQQFCASIGQSHLPAHALEQRKTRHALDLFYLKGNRCGAQAQSFRDTSEGQPLNDFAEDLKLPMVTFLMPVPKSRGLKSRDTLSYHTEHLDLLLVKLTFTLR
jgi:hypothetical protein